MSIFPWRSHDEGTGSPSSSLVNQPPPNADDLGGTGAERTSASQPLFHTLNAPSASVQIDESAWFLFKYRPGFDASLNRFADHIRSAPSRESLTFAVYGPWGSGKSTALRYLESSLAEDEKAGLLSFARYDAPSWQEFSLTRCSLAYEIIRGACRNDPKKFRNLIIELYEYFELKTREYPVDEPELMTAIDFITAFTKASVLPPALENWLQWKIEHLQAERRSRHVVFVDDLDRCDEKFTADLLAAINYWVGNPRITAFFVLAANEQHLANSLVKFGVRGPDNSQAALDKYVHVSIEMPELVITRREVSRYLRHLADRVSLRPDGMSAQHETSLREQLNTMLDEASNDYPNGSLTPLLPPDGVRLTPRAVRARLNTLLTEFKPPRPTDSIPTSVLLTAENVKEWVIKAFWPDFWWSHIYRLLDLSARAELSDSDGTPMKAELADLAGKITSIIKCGEGLLPLHRENDATLRATLDLLARADMVDLSDIDPRLAMYLAASPRYEPPGAEGYAEIPPLPAPSLTVDDAILDNYVRAEGALKNGDDDQCARYVQEISRLAAEKGVTSLSAIYIGNSAVTAKQLRMPGLALRLHRAAMAIDETNYHIKQNYVDFVLDPKLDQQYRVGEMERARQELIALEQQGSNYQPARTRALRARFDMLEGKNIDQDALFAAQMQYLREEPSVQRLVEIFTLTADASRAESAVRVTAEASDDDGDRSTILRMFADRLATNPDLDDKERDTEERESIDIYRYLLATGLAAVRDASGPPDVKHNLAIALNGPKYRHAAAAIWREVYQERSGDVSVRRAFAVTLQRMDFDAAATAALAGQRLPEFDLQPEPLPDRFWDGDPWWERLPIGLYPPCPTELDWLYPSRLRGEA